MTIFVLIILCLYTLGGVHSILKGIGEDKAPMVIGGLFKTLLGTLAIIFQSLNL